MVNKFEMPAYNMGNKPEESSVKKVVSSEEFWENYRKEDSQRPADHGDKSPREAMDRIKKEVEEVSAKRTESIREITDGIKRRLNDWGRKDLHTLLHHLDGNMIRFQNSTFDESFNELVAKCDEGTEFGKAQLDEKGNVTSRFHDPNVASRALIDRLPWVINHDDTSLGMEAGKVISLRELRDLVKEVLKEQ